MDESAGATAEDSSGNNFDGTYNGPTLANDTAPDGNNAPTFDGLNDIVDISASSGSFNGSAGTLVIWIKTSAWEDATTRDVNLIQADSNNRIFIRKTSTNNRMTFIYKAGGITKTITKDGVSDTDWICIGLTWSDASGSDQFKVYFNGVQEGSTLTGNGTWVGVPGTMTISRSSVFWSGSLALCALFNNVKNASAMADLADVSGTPAVADITEYTERATGAIGFFDNEAHFAQIGTAQVVVNNADRRFSPTYTDGAYFGNQWVNAVLTIESGAYTVFKGYIQSVEPQPGVGRTRRAVIYCEDILGWLSRAPLSIPLQESRQMAYLLRLIGSEVFKTEFASGTITFTANTDDQDTLTLGVRTYTFKATPAAAYDVQIGSTKEDTAENLAAAINDDESVTDAYFANTIRSPEASAAVSGAVITITALARGTAGNAIAMSTTSPHHDANSLTINTGGIESGTLSDTFTQDGNYLELDEVTGTPGFDYQFDFTDVSTDGTSINMYGRYDGSGAHTVNVNAWNWGGASYDNLGTLVSSGSDALHTFTLTAAHTSGDAVRIQFEHTSAGNINHRLWVDHLYVAAAPPISSDAITLSGATLENGTDGPDDTDYATGIQVFDIAADAWSEEKTNALRAYMQVIESEFGYGWAARDSTITAKDRNWEFELPSNTPTMVIDNAHENQTSELGSQIYNQSTVSYEPRGTVANQVVARANNVISVPGSTEGVRWNRLVKLHESGELDTLPAGVVTFRLPYVQENTGGRVVGATSVIMPKRGEDYQLNDQPDGSGFDYSTTFPPRIIISAVITGSGIECTFSNSALGTIYIIGLEIRGTAVIAYDRQQVNRESTDSISAYGKRSKQYHLPLASGEIFATSLANHLINRHKDPAFRVQSINIHDALTQVGGVDPLSIEIGDTVQVDEGQTTIDDDINIVRGIRFEIGSGGNAISLNWKTKAALDKTYWILGDATYGILGDTTRLAI
jgi:hypothetical protein